MAEKGMGLNAYTEVSYIKMPLYKTIADICGCAEHLHVSNSLMARAERTTGHHRAVEHKCNNFVFRFGACEEELPYSGTQGLRRTCW